MKSNVFAGNDHNQYNTGTIVKEVADFYGQSIRTTDADSVVSGYFTHFRATYDGSNNPTEVSYYRGTKAYQTSVTFTPAATLNNKYFILHSAPNEQVYVIWFDVDGAGTAPVYSGIKIRIQVSAGDSAEIVAAMVKLTLDSLYSDVFTAGTRNGANLQILTAGFGEVPDSFDVNTGFAFATTPGEQALVTKIIITYTGTDPVYQGQLLKDYNFDIYSGKFTKNPEITVGNVSISDSDGDSLAINPDGSLNVNVLPSGQELKSFFFETNSVNTGITEQICTYTPTAPVLLQKIEVSGTNISTYELYINGIKQDKKLTYFSGGLNVVFEFNQGISVATGNEIEVRAFHNRPNTGDYAARVQILE